MKIVHTEWSDGLGGQEKRVLAELQGMAERGHGVRLVCRGHAAIKGKAEAAGIPTQILPMRSPYDLQSIIRLSGVLRKSGAEVLNTHSGVDSWIGGIAAKLAGVPVLIRTRHLNIPLKRHIFNFIHYLPDMYITCGTNMLNTLRACGFPAEMLTSIPTGVGDQFFSLQRNPSLKQKYGISENAPVVVNVGILRNVKGQEVTLRAVSAVAAEFPAVRFLFAGDGPTRERLENTAQTLGVTDRVLFTGFIEDIAEIYSLADVSVLSSWSEGLPQSVLQSMAAGVPVIATAVGGVPEVVVPEKTGILVDAGDHEAMAEGIVRLLRDRSAAAVFSENAKRLVRERHSLAHMLDSTEALYRRLLAEKR